MKTRIIGSIVVIIVLLVLYVLSGTTEPQQVPSFSSPDDAALKSLSIN